MSLAVSIGAETISVYHNGEYYQVDKSHANYGALREELRKQPRDVEAILQLVELPKFLSHVTAGRVEVGADAVLFSGEPVSGYMVDRLLQMAHAGEDVASWARFMDNLMDNPLPGVREDLYKWMETGKMPITEDGCLVAFKKVRKDYTDVHTGKFDNSVGAVLEMDRALCDTNRNNTCSTGFHFCSAGYLSSFGGQRVMVVKINPRDVTAIPADYNNQKARCCQYTVTGELSSQSAAQHKVWSSTNVVKLEDPQELPEVMLPRKGKPVGQVAVDASRTSGPPPVDDLAAPAAQPAPAKRKKAAALGKAPAPAQPGAADGQFRVLPKPAYRSSKLGVDYTPQQVLQAMVDSGGKFSAAAAQLGVPPTTLKGWVKRV